MKKILLKIISLKLVILFGAVLIINTQKVEAGTLAKEMVSTIVYDNYFEAGVEVLGVEVPVGISISGGSNAIGQNFNCEWAFSYCSGQIGFVPFD